ncbi:cobalamin-binding protein [Schlesneria paludicola]|uniref:cobalamin-binding protein n=1 Tax=Schlesneria paludicola TaxID=360056 RepID=UPI00029A4E09|nr:cobalamin-binding protein [Schlesneria paludicola]
MRIVSLLPSATEIICQLGLEKSLVGVTHECDYPPHVRDLPKVTQTLIPTDASSLEIDQLVRERLKNNRALYSLNLPVLEQLRPDLIITQALCDVCAVAEAEVTAAACNLPGHPRVLNLEPMSVHEVLSTLIQVGTVAGIPERATEIVDQLRSRIDAVAARSQTVSHRPKVVILEWIDPPFSCGHWSPEIVRLAGGDEQLGRPGIPSQTLDWLQVIQANPDVIVIACCGFNVARTLVDVDILRTFSGWNDIPAVKANQVYVIDGNAYFSRPGPRLIESLELLAHALHPDIHPAPIGIPPALRLIS